MQANLSPLVLLTILEFLETKNHDRVETRFSSLEPSFGFGDFAGNVNGVKSCGGNGKFVLWHIDDCKEKLNAPSKLCVLTPAPMPTISKFVFVPSANYKEIGIRIKVLTDGRELQGQVYPFIENSSVIANIEYTMTLNHEIGIKFAYKKIALQYFITGGENSEPVVCAEAPLEIVGVTEKDTIERIVEATPRFYEATLDEPVTTTEAGESEEGDPESQEN